MNNIFEKLVETDFEGTFKPLAGDELKKREAEHLQELKTVNSDILQLVFDDLIYETAMDDAIDDISTRVLKLYSKAMDSSEFKRSAAIKAQEYLDDFQERVVNSINYRKGIDDD